MSAEALAAANAALEGARAEAAAAEERAAAVQAAAQAQAEELATKAARLAHLEGACITETRVLPPECALVSCYLTPAAAPKYGGVCR